MTTLYQITGDLIALKNAVLEETEETGELSSETEERVLQWIGDIRETSQEKLIGCAHVLLNWAGQKKMIDEERKRLKKRSEALDNAGRRLKSFIKYFMNTAELKKIEAGAFTFTECKNGGLAPLLMEALPAGLPEKYQVHIIEAATSLIRQDLEDGVEIKDCSLGERGTHIRVK